MHVCQSYVHPPRAPKTRSSAMNTHVPGKVRRRSLKTWCTHTLAAPPNHCLIYKIRVYGDRSPLALTFSLYSQTRTPNLGSCLPATLFSNRHSTHASMYGVNVSVNGEQLLQTFYLHVSGVMTQEEGNGKAVYYAQRGSIYI